jgi:hypothetical protein
VNVVEESFGQMKVRFADSVKEKSENNLRRKCRKPSCQKTEVDSPSYAMMARLECLLILISGYRKEEKGRGLLCN